MTLQEDLFGNRERGALNVLSTFMQHSVTGDDIHNSKLQKVNKTDYTSTWHKL